MERKFAGALIQARDTGRIFLMLRCEVASNPLTWAMVSGGIEGEETVLDGLKREIVEECSIDPEIIDFVEIEQIPESKGTFYYFQGFTDSEFIPTLDFENLDWGWFDKDDLPDPLYPDLQYKIDTI